MRDGVGLKVTFGTFCVGDESPPVRLFMATFLSLHMVGCEVRLPLAPLPRGECGQ